MLKNTHQILRWIGALTLLIGYTATNSSAQFTYAAPEDLTGLTTIGASYTTFGNNLAANGYTDAFTMASSPGSATAQAAPDAFYKVTTNGCTDQLTISTCGMSTNFDTYIHVLDAMGNEITSNDNSALTSCIVTVLNESGVTLSVTGNTVYYIVVEGAGTAEGDFDLNILEEDLVPFVVTATATSSNVCSGGSISLNAAPGGMTSYAWAGTGTAFSSSTQNPTIAAATTAETDLYEVVVTNAAGCTAASDVFVTVSDPPVVDAGTAGAICASTGTASVTGSISGGFTGVWTTSGGGTFSNGGVYSNLGINYTPAGSDLMGFTAGSKTITLTLSSDAVPGGCLAVTSTLMLTLYECPSLTTTPAAFCAGGNVDLTTKVSDASGAAGAITWYPTQTDAQNETAALGSTTVTAGGTYWARKNSTTTPACSDIESVVITMDALPNVSAVASGPLSCNTPSVTLTASSTDVVTPTFEWTTGVPGATRTAMTIGSFTVTATSAAGCISTASVTTTGSLTPSGPLAGTYYIPSACFPTINDAATYLDANGVSANVTFEVANTHTETAPTGGINLFYGAVPVANQTNATQSVTFRRSGGAGARPVVTGSIGGGGADAIFAIIGMDYVIFDGIEVKDDVAFTTDPDRNEYGFVIYDNGADDGAQHITLQNNKITLSNQNSEAIGIYQETAFSPTSADGGNSYNKFFSNEIDNVTHGIAINGQTVNDVDNEIGAMTMGNTITNFAAVTAPSALVGVHAGIYVFAQQNAKIVGNTVSGGTATLNALISGIATDANDGAGVNPSVTVTNNTVTAVSGSTGQSIFAIWNFSGSRTNAATVVNINNNTITGCRNYVSTTGAFRAIRNHAHAGIVNMNDNTVSNMNPAVGDALFGNGNVGFIHHVAAAPVATGQLNIKNNTIQNVKLGNQSGFAFTTEDTRTDVFILTTSGTSSNAAASTWVGGALNGIEVSGNTLNNITYSATRGVLPVTTTGNGRATLGIAGRSPNSNNIFNNNTITNITFAGGAGMDAGTALMGQTAGFFNSAFMAIAYSGGQGASTVQMNNNTVSNINMGALNGSVITLLSSPSLGATASLQNNNINNISNAVFNQVFRGISTAGSSNAIVQNNTINNVNTSINGLIQGISASGQVSVNISNNTITNFSTIAGGITGITSTSPITATSAIISGNTVGNLSLTAGASFQVTGISGGAANNTQPVSITKNNVYGLSIAHAQATCSIRGISLGLCAATVANNFVSDLTATGTTQTGTVVPVIGINQNTATIFKVYHNTVAIGGLPTAGVAGTPATGGANFGVSGIHFVAPAAQVAPNVTPVIDIRDNLLYINATNAGTAGVAAIRRSLSGGVAKGGANATFTMNNNVYYVPTAANHSVYTEGATGTQTNTFGYTTVGGCGSTYKTFMSPQEGATFVEIPPFTNTGVVPNNLKIDILAGYNSVTSNGGVPVPAVTDDYFATARSGSSPDIGAHEYVDGSADAVPPSYTFTPVPNQSCPTSAVTVVATITDASGVSVAAGVAPRLWYKTSTNLNVLPTTNTSADDGWKYVEATSIAGNNYTFTFDYSLLFGGAPASGSILNYFFSAQDLAGAPNAGINATPTGCVAAGGLVAGNFGIASFSTFNYGAAPAGPFTIAASGTFFCAPNSVIFTASPTNSGLSYDWYEGGALVTTTSTPTYTAMVSATNTYSVVVGCGGSPIGTSTPVTVTISNVTLTSVASTAPANTVCGDTPFDLVGVATPAAAIVSWYPSATSTSPITPSTGLVIATTTTYWAEAQLTTPVSTLGSAVHPAAGGTQGGPFSGPNLGQVVNTAGAQVEINSVDAYTAGTPGTMRILLVDATNSVVGSYLHTCATGVSPVKQTIPVHFRIPAGQTGWRVVVSDGATYPAYPAGSNSPFVTSAMTPSPYPYTAANGAITMTGATQNSATSMYLYNFQVQAICTAPRQSITITQTPPPGAVTIATPAPACGSATTPLTAVDVASAYTTFTWSNASTGATISVTPAVTTTYTVTATAGTCSTTASVTVTVLPTPSITATTATPDAICNPGTSSLASAIAVMGPNTYAFAASSSTYTPLVGATAAVITGTVDDGSQVPIPLGFTFNYNGTAFTTFGLAVNGHIQLGSGAFPADTWTNTLQSRPNAIAPMWDDNHLGTGAISYLMSGVAPNRVMTIQWANVAIGGGGNPANSTNNYQVQLFEGTDVVQFNYGTLTAANGLSASIGISGAAGNYQSVTPGTPATSSPSVENTIVSSVAAIPTGTVYTFTPNVITYAWTSTPAGFTSAVQNPGTVSPTATTVYNVVVTNATTGCTASSSTTVTVVNPPVAGTSTTITPNVCNNSAASIDMNTSLGTHDAGGVWTTTAPSGFTAGTGVFVPTSVAAGTYTFTYTVAATTPCTTASTATVTLTLEQGLVAPVLADATYCQGVAATALDATTSGATTYAWSNSTSMASLTPSTVTAGTTTYTVTVSSGAAGVCASVTASATITVIAPPNAGTSASAPATCSNSTTSIDLDALLGANDAGGVWAETSGTPSTSGFTAGTGMFVPNTNAAGTYTFTYTVAATAPCTVASTATATVVLTAPVTAGTGSSVNSCANSATSIDLFGLLTGEDAGGMWTETSAVPSTSGFTAGVSGTFVPNTNAAATYMFTYTMTGTGGCTSSTATATVVVAAPATAPVLTGATYCQNAVATALDATITNGVSYLWNDGAATALAMLTPSTTSAATTIYTVTVTPSAGCAAVTASATIIINAAPVGGLTPATQAICSGSAIAPISITPAPAAGTLASAPLSTTSNRGIYFNLTNNTASTVYISSMQTNVGASVVAAHEYHLYATTSANTYVANTNVAGNWTLIGLLNYTIPATGFVYAQTIPVTASGGYALAAGQTRGFYIVAANPGGTATTTGIVAYQAGTYNTNPATVTDGNLTFTRGVSSGTSLFPAAAATLSRHAGVNINYNSGTTFAWTRDNTANVTGTGAGSLATGTTFPINANLTNTQATAQTTVYTMTATGLNGCTATSTASVTVNVPATVNAGVSQSICAGQTATLAGSFGGAATTATWTTAGTGTFGSTGTGTSTLLTDVYTPSAADIAANSVVLTLTTDVPAGGGACTAAAKSVTIAINSAPTVTNYTVCQNTAVPSGAGMGATGSCGTVALGPFVGDLAATDPVYQRAEVAATTGSSTVTAIAPTAPNGTAVFYDTYTFVAPVSGSYTFTGNSTGLDGFGFLYNGSFNPAAPTTNAIAGSDDTGGAPYNNDPIITANLVGGQTYVYVMTSWNNGGTGAYAINVVTPASTLTWFTAATGGTQIGAGATFNPVGVAGSGVVDTNTPGTTTFYAACNGSNCRTAVDFIVAPGATANAGLDGVVCVNASFVLGSASIGGSATAAAWTTSGDGSFDNASSTNPSYTPGAADATAGTVTLTLTATDPMGAAPCNTAMDMMVLTVQPVPVGTNYEVCQGGTVVGGLQMACSTGTTGTATVNFNIAAQPTEVTSEVFNGFVGPFGTLGTGTMAALPAGAVVTGATLTCNGITALGGSWQADVHIGLSGATTVTPTVSTPFVGNATGNVAGVFNYTSTIAPASIPVAGGALTLNYWDSFADNAGAESTYPTGATAAVLTINYTLPAPSWYAAASGGSSLGTGTTFDPTTAGYTTATAGVTTFYAQCSANGCRTPVTFTVTAPANAGMSGSAATVCNSSTTSIDLDAVLGANDAGGTWAETSVTASTSGFTAGTGMFVPNTNAAGTYTFTYTVTGTGSCPSSTATVTVIVTGAPVAVVTGAGALTCTTTTLTLDASTSTNTDTYAWTTTGTITGATNGATVVAAAAGDYTVVVTNTASGCQATSTVSVTGGTLAPTATITGGGGILSCTNSTITLGASTSTNADTYAWTSTGAFTGMASDASIGATAAGDYTVVVTNTASGCQATATVSISGAAAPSNNVALTMADQNAIPAECDGGPWTYYGNPADGNNNVFFAIKWNSNTAAKNTATVTIDVASGTDVTHPTTPQRTWTLDRQWDVQNAGTNDFTADPVSVRFYYTPGALTTLNATAASYLAGIQSANPTYVVESPTWFHAAAAGGTWSNNGADILGAEALTGTTGTENGVNYIEFAGITHFSGGTFAVGVGPSTTPLPVKLISFTGAINGKANDLTWKTASEQNVASFIVERSTNGTTGFKPVGNSVAPTNTNVEQTYRLTDNDPTSRAYYRLRMTDLDGTVAYSNVVTLIRRTGDLSVAAIYPNPTNGMINVEYDLATASTVNFVVVDVLGRVVANVKTQGDAGFNMQKIDLADFASGVYTIIMDKGTSERVIRKVVKE